MKTRRFELIVAQPDPDEKGLDEEEASEGETVAYLRLPGHPGSVAGIVKKTVVLRDLIPDYLGSEVVLDFDENNRLIGVEFFE